MGRSLHPSYLSISQRPYYNVQFISKQKLCLHTLLQSLVAISVRTWRWSKTERDKPIGETRMQDFLLQVSKASLHRVAPRLSSPYVDCALYYIMCIKKILYRYVCSIEIGLPVTLIQSTDKTCREKTTDFCKTTELQLQTSGKLNINLGGFYSIQFSYKNRSHDRLS